MQASDLFLGGQEAIIGIPYDGSYGVTFYPFGSNYYRSTAPHPSLQTIGGAQQIGHKPLVIYQKNKFILVLVFQNGKYQIWTLTSSPAATKNGAETFIRKK